MERGDFDDLPGAGKPIPGLRARRRDVVGEAQAAERGPTYLPPALALRREAERGLEEALRATSEARVRQIIEGVNEQIRGPTGAVPATAVLLAPYDVDGVVERWRQRRSWAFASATASGPAAAELAGRVGRGEVHRLGDVGLLRDDGGPGEGGHDAVRERRVGLGDQLLVALSGVGGEACRGAVARSTSLTRTSNASSSVPATP